MLAKAYCLVGEDGALGPPGNQIRRTQWPRVVGLGAFLAGRQKNRSEHGEWDLYRFRHELGRE